MKDMKQSKKAAEKAMPSSPGIEEYPYGLRLRLGKEEMKKLGFDKLPAVGEEFEVEAKAHVVGVQASDSAEGGDYASCELQITHLDLESDGDNEVAADKLFGKKG